MIVSSSSVWVLLAPLYSIRTLNMTLIVMTTMTGTTPASIPMIIDIVTVTIYNNIGSAARRSIMRCLNVYIR